MRRCAACGKPMREHDANGRSALYSPDEKFTLCVPCWFEEDSKIDEQGTNVLPDVIAKYRQNLRTP